MQRIRQNWLMPMLLFCCATAISRAVEPVESRSEQARQFRATQTRTDAALRGAETTASSPEMGAQDESFGVQQILKREEKLRPFNAFAEASAFYTNNVALTHRNGKSD